MTERRTQNDLDFGNGEMVEFAEPTPEDAGDSCCDGPLLDLSRAWWSRF
jgi:hypothetical protein